MYPALLGIDWLDPEWLISWFGPFVLVGVCAIVFLETGVLVLSFLPGDSLLFTVGLFTATGVIPYPIWVVAPLIFLSAFAGDQLAYTLGRRIGPSIFNREKSRFFNPENVERTHEFFEKYGGKAIIIVRFLPIFRAFVPVAAGVGKMPRRHFAAYNAIGAFLWAIGVTLIGFFLGQIEFVRNYSEYFIIAMVLIPGIPILIEMYRGFRSTMRKRAAAAAEASRTPEV
ncbi:VTT domain-containing protein [Klugiella xanthotipulae]|uniref:Membrane-associated protein n=1 Tax=Klugiella xanthotipulae TaxID=244735 RepID=A0A543I484_9MICO|nr:VTT domain-containing protein [Klugiella xanthotipulae]TQM65398.1 membrane-associated protein [Klugiella xanthotipulae]